MITITLLDNGNVAISRGACTVDELATWPDTMEAKWTSGRHCFHVSIESHALRPVLGCVHQSPCFRECDGGSTAV